MTKSTLMLVLSLSFLFGGIVSCSNNDNLIIIDKETNVLENSYPLNYPSTKPMPNKIIRVLNNGEKVKIVKYIYGKDYLAYKISLNDGEIGYIIHSDTFRIIKTSNEK